MSKISPCFKKTFIFFNALFAICGIVIFASGLFLHQFIEEILASLMSLAMMIRITAPAVSQKPHFSLSYQPPKYSEVVNY
ncbi:hypothetical protein Baya_13764 [Bagarius yarrelli]|uniref:Uncharacterized protein n=1 Tax=Bagarius yarrelli TaxID=175774 RepID=A0A556V8F6_BAGYA|nr:hypothetical protein Baya_13764 [Bagarius yarrelli]